MAYTAAMAFVAAFMDDLMFLSRIREAAGPRGIEVRGVRKLPDLIAACRDVPRLVFVDLEAARLPVSEALAALRAEPELARIPVVGFYNHVHVDLAREAQAAGCAQVLTRGAFVRELGALLEKETHEPTTAGFLSGRHPR